MGFIHQEANKLDFQLKRKPENTAEGQCPKNILQWPSDTHQME